MSKINKARNDYCWTSRAGLVEVLLFESGDYKFKSGFLSIIDKQIIEQQITSKQVITV
jgi:hypothetical protein